MARLAAQQFPRSTWVHAPSNLQAYTNQTGEVGTEDPNAELMVVQKGTLLTEPSLQPLRVEF